MITKKSTKYANVLMIVWSKPGGGSRRAVEVADRLGWKLHYSFPKKPCSIPIKILWCLRDSIKKIRDVKPDVLVHQIGPSIACFVGIWANIRYRIPVIYDSHSSVYMLGMERFFRWLRKIAFRLSLTVLIHNDDHVCEVEALGGKPTVLRDPIPRFPDVDTTSKVFLKNPAVFCPLSWHSDEPIEAMLEVAKKSEGFSFYFSGSPRGDYDLPENVTLTGLLSPEVYLSYLKSCDVILALTNQESTVSCAGHEAIAVKRPFVTSDTQALRNRFKGFAIFTSLDPHEIASQIKEAYKTTDDISAAAYLLEDTFEEEWTKSSRFLLATQ